MKAFKKIGLILVLVLVTAMGLALHYYLPKTEKVIVVGTEVKWNDATKLATEKDVRYIFTKRHNSHKALVFRNEDMPWPPYFKFDSGDLSGQAVALQKTQPEPVALVTYYGWRIHFLSLYPNATHLEVVAADYKHTPWFNWIFLSALGVFILWSLFRIRTLIRKWRKKNGDAPSKDTPVG
jgi:hypothetical protein